jgi:hypothetical protein
MSAAVGRAGAQFSMCVLGAQEVLRTLAGSESQSDSDVALNCLAVGPQIVDSSR